MPVSTIIRCWIFSKANGTYDGIVMSDWFGTYDEAVPTSGLDLEMPGPVARWMASVHQGVALYITVKNKGAGSFETLKNIAGNKGTVILLDQITDPHNLGSIIRSAEALGCGAVIIPKNNSAEVNETVVKTSAGATAHIEIITITNVARFLDDLKKMKFWIIGTSDHGNMTPGRLKEFLPACIIIGNEGKGMRRLTEEKCDYIASIPLKGKVSSLNASVAAGIVIYEIMKGNGQ